MDEAAFGLDLGLLQADAFGAWRAAHRDQDFFRLLDDLFAVGGGVGDLDAGFGLLDLLELGADIDVDAALLEEAGELLADLLVLGGNQAGKVLDDGDFAAEAVEDGPELHAHRARADDDHRFRDRRDGEDLHIGQDAVVRREAGQHLGVGAGGDEDVFRLDGLMLAFGLDVDGVDAVLRRAGKLAVAGEGGDLVLPH